MDPTWQQAWRDQTSAWGAYPHNPGDHADLGLSTYNTHTDGAGISIASWHRPMLNLRLGFLTYPYPDIRASGLRHYPTDTHLTMWLEAKGFAYDIITDWELHHEGRDLLAAYQVVLTGTHPEYHTREMLDALQDYRDGGGRFCYFGGNGFYW
ncbi:MAG: N,N-dimethylformamidase beta subunit family domain-containing protein, partial [Pseudomonadota bacterium]